MQPNRALILRGNRFLGSALVEKRLVTVAQLEQANERFMELVQSGQTEVVSILNILIHELKVLEEAKLMEYYVETEKLGLVDLDHYRVAAARDLGYDISAARSSLTVPFDRLEGFTCLATAYKLSAPVVKQWEELYEGKIIWYASSLRSISNFLQRVEELEEAILAEEAEAEETAAEIAANQAVESDPKTGASDGS